MALIGYARVSTEDQSLDLQRDALKERGCGRIFEEKVSGKTKERPQLKAMLGYLRDGEDTVVIYKLDRLGRSMKDLIEITEALAGRGIGLISIRDGIDMTTATGRLYFHLMACLAEFERDLISERTRAGLASARARGRQGGRKPADPKKLEQAYLLYDSNTLSVADICKMVGISETTFYRYNKERKAAERKGSGDE
ncbi:MAG: recombinase family protein [Coriobacteriales bacterium]